MHFWCEINKSKIKNNIAKIREFTKDKKIAAVIKCNAYGLGIEEMSSFIEEEVDLLAVSTLDEAKKINTKKDILIMSPLYTVASLNDSKENYIYTVDDEKDLDRFNPKKNYRIHLYINTGMNRLGIEADAVDTLVWTIKNNYPNIKIEGMYTHLHNASNIRGTKKQINLFKNIYEKFRDEVPYFHCLNSKGVLNEELNECASFTNMVRVGNLLYGYDGIHVNGIEQVFKIKAKVVKSYFVKDDGYIGYGEKSRVKAGTNVGVLHCGSIDKLGYKKDIKGNKVKDFLKNVKHMVIKSTYIYCDGKPLELLCVPNMNCTLIDISNIKKKSGQDIIVDVNISSILLDSSIRRVYV